MCAKTSLSLFSRWGQNYPRIELDSTDIFEIHVIHILLIMMVFGNYVHFILLLLFVISLFFLILREWWQVFTSSKNALEWFSKFAPPCPRRKRQKSKNLAINRTRKTQIGRSTQISMSRIFMTHIILVRLRSLGDRLIPGFAEQSWVERDGNGDRERRKRLKARSSSSDPPARPSTKLR